MEGTHTGGKQPSRGAIQSRLPTTSQVLPGAEWRPPCMLQATSHRMNECCGVPSGCCLSGGACQRCKPCMHGVTCELVNGMCVLRMNWLHGWSSMEPGGLVSATGCAAARAVHQPVRTCTLQRSYAGRCLSEATATPNPKGQGSACPEACPPLALGRPCCNAVLAGGQQWILRTKACCLLNKGSS